MLRLLILLILAPILLASVYKVIHPLTTPLMLIRLTQGHPIHYQWVPLKNMNRALIRSVVAAEDADFCTHNGFDWEAMNKAYSAWQTHKQGQPIKGGSTISQQTAKNVFLWPGRTVVRKALEIPLTALIETLWGKTRILEVYLNVVEFGPGVYGVGAASRLYFKTTPARLSPQQAARLIAVLPSPLHWSAKKPGPYVRERAGTIRARSYGVEPLLNCIQGW